MSKYLGGLVTATINALGKKPTEVEYLVVAGGGGGGGNRGTYGGGAGGSGIVIIRYPQTLSPPAAVTGNVQIGYAAGYQIYTWTSSGTVTF